MVTVSELPVPCCARTSSRILAERVDWSTAKPLAARPAPPPGCSKLWWLKPAATLLCLIVGIG